MSAEIAKKIEESLPESTALALTIHPRGVKFHEEMGGYEVVFELLVDGEKPIEEGMFSNAMVSLEAVDDQTPEDMAASSTEAVAERIATELCLSMRDIMEVHEQLQKLEPEEDSPEG
jgi:hypothetical protein